MITSIDEIVEKLEFLYIASEKVKCCRCIEKQFCRSSEKLNVSPYDPEIPVLGK